jgi:hypothetical protein
LKYKGRIFLLLRPLIHNHHYSQRTYDGDPFNGLLANAGLRVGEVDRRAKIENDHHLQVGVRSLITGDPPSVTLIT